MALGYGYSAQLKCCVTIVDAPGPGWRCEDTRLPQKDLHLKWRDHLQMAESFTGKTSTRNLQVMSFFLPVFIYLSWPLQFCLLQFIVDIFSFNIWFKALWLLHSLIIFFDFSSEIDLVFSSACCLNGSFLSTRYSHFPQSHKVLKY